MTHALQKRRLLVIRDSHLDQFPHQRTNIITMPSHPAALHGRRVNLRRDCVPQVVPPIYGAE